MAIQKYQDSFSDMMPGSFSSMLDRFFSDSLASRGRVASFSPQVDAYETEKGYEIEAALPGLKREDIKVDFHQGRLTIAGERQFRNEQNQRRYHVVESSYGSFSRSFQLPDTVDPSKIEASFEDGVLHVTVPKDEKKTMRHQIQVRGSQNSSNPSGQLSERMGQQATDIPVQNGATSNSTDASSLDSNLAQSNGSGSASTAMHGSGVGA
ncbi:Hsp20/alpha crystallin family protein [Hymenobacter sp. GOD-10R]|uniref:Hsp20/alpha crystallin family protein n=1 Tax=Hymenobacter sp. GOD-10R TaxID=3093922 RepID=UPI002D77B564|nr:Hsp20/alpha crystallin family protein [Hymenobacter sp. GOD-10R]WRQ28751.1 Hsp20/alpha crystallin family protein [Hymenobacter sp. GOD-10R]